MSDIMDRLADWYDYHKMNEYEQSAKDIGKLMVEASEEIERLRARLAEAEALFQWIRRNTDVTALDEIDDRIDAFLAQEDKP